MKPEGKKAKGTRLERIFAQMLVDAELDPYAKRMVLSGSVKGFDGDTFTRLPIHTECKNQETWSPLAYYQQCKDSNPNPGRKMNVVVMSKNRTEPFVFITAQDFVNLFYYAIKGGYE